MKYYKCAIKGSVSSAECFACYTVQKDKLAASRVLCQKEYVVKDEPVNQGDLWGLFVTQGQGSGTTPDLEFASLESALQHTAQHKGEASFGIKNPDGTWHKWD